MTDEQINKAIAESIGWKLVHLQEQIELRGVLRGYPPNVECVGVNQEYVTDYCNDLNAMHEAEKLLETADQQSRYYAEIADITWWNVETGNRQVVFNQLTATAKQRAEAFLKTLNLWTE